MKKEIKTNVMRLLDKSGIKYETLYYDLGDEKFSGEAVSDYLGLEYDTCFKTLALKHEHDLFIAVIPVDKNLDLKKCAKAFEVKNLEMVKVKDLLKEVGYERGSVSPVGIKKKHRVAFDTGVLNHEKIEISGGLMGIGLIVDREEIIRYLKAEVLDICEEK